MGIKKPLRTTDDLTDVSGMKLIMCVVCETDDDITHSSQAISVVRGFSLCREHMNRWILFGIHDIPSKN